MFCSERKISFLYAEKDERNNLPSFLGHDLRSERKISLVRCATLSSNCLEQWLPDYAYETHLVF